MGPYFFHFVAKQMNVTLVNGYQKHILSYTLFFLLKCLIEKRDEEGLLIETGTLDYCLEDILPVFIDEILGKVRDEKEVQEIKNRIPEFKTSKAYDGFQLLSCVIDFNRSVKFSSWSDFSSSTWSTS
jgi:U3 small nucleolar RNA-associated protein 20